MIEKLRLKNTSLRTKCKKLTLHLKQVIVYICLIIVPLSITLLQKEESGEVRHEVDFKQLKIENKRYSEHYEEKNQELLKLKLTAGNTLQVLNSYKASNSLISMRDRPCKNQPPEHEKLLVFIIFGLP